MPNGSLLAIRSIFVNHSQKAIASFQLIQLTG